MREGGLLICGEEYFSECKDAKMKECLVYSKDSKMASGGRVQRTNRKVSRYENGEVVRGHNVQSFVGHYCIPSVMYSHGMV